MDRERRETLRQETGRKCAETERQTVGVVVGCVYFLYDTGWLFNRLGLFFRLLFGPFLVLAQKLQFSMRTYLRCLLWTDFIEHSSRVQYTLLVMSMNAISTWSGQLLAGHVYSWSALVRPSFLWSWNLVADYLMYIKYETLPGPPFAHDVFPCGVFPMHTGAAKGRQRLISDFLLGREVERTPPRNKRCPETKRLRGSRNCPAMLLNPTKVCGSKPRSKSLDLLRSLHPN